MQSMEGTAMEDENIDNDGWIELYALQTQSPWTRRALIQGQEL